MAADSETETVAEASAMDGVRESGGRPAADLRPPPGRAGEQAATEGERRGEAAPMKCLHRGQTADERRRCVNQVQLGH